MERTHHDGRTGEAARPADEHRIRAFTGAGRAAEEDQFLGKPELVTSVLRFQVLPDGIKYYR